MCGDGRNFGTLACDDNNTNNGDGCTNLCEIETGFYCAGGDYNTPDTCSEICGDGMNFGKYQCDDGNMKDLDGCSSSCKIE